MTYLIIHRFQGNSGDGDDGYVNTFHLESVVAIDATTGPQIATAIKNFYDGHASADADKPHYYYSKAVQNPGRSIKMYDLEDAKPRSTRYEETSTANPFATVAAAPPLPAEVALCLSFEAIGASGTVQARRRGRIYLGPFNQQAEGADGSGKVSFPKQDLIDACLSEFQLLQSGLLAIGFDLVVYSPTNNQSLNISRCWMDNAWDTQRRRGDDPTGKTQLLLP